MDKRSAIVVGAGIAGLATARALALKGYQVKVFERGGRATGASVRNFGMLWPIGQPEGKLYQRAIRSRDVWQQIAADGGVWCEAVGSLHLAYHADEWQVLQELHSRFSAEGRQVELLSKEQVLEKSPASVEKNLSGGLFSREEVIVDPRQAIGALPAYFTEKLGIEFFWNKCISYVADQTVYIGNDEEYTADLIVICSGADFETLYPEAFGKYPLTKVKLQMMRMAPQPNNWRLGPALCGGLSLIHYKSFQSAPSLSVLRARYESTMPDYIRWGIHVMVSQNGFGELTVGDSHEYGLTHDPFDKELINRLVLEYLAAFAHFPEARITETWNGVYPKLTNGDTDLFFSPEPGVYILNGLGGAGMTLSFGFAEECMASL